MTIERKYSGRLMPSMPISYELLMTSIHSARAANCIVPALP